MLIKGILTLGILIVIGGLGLPYFGSGFLGIQDEGRAAKVVEFTRNLSDVMLTSQITDPAGEPVSEQLGGTMTDVNVRDLLDDLFSKDLQVDQGIVMPGVAVLADTDGTPGNEPSVEVLVVSSPELSNDICQNINKTLDLVDVEGDGRVIAAPAFTTAGFTAELTSGTALTADQLANISEALAAEGMQEDDGVTPVTTLEGACFQDDTNQNIFVHVVGEI